MWHYFAGFVLMPLWSYSLSHMTLRNAISVPKSILVMIVKAVTIIRELISWETVTTVGLLLFVDYWNSNCIERLADWDKIYSGEEKNSTAYFWATGMWPFNALGKKLCDIQGYGTQGEHEMTYEQSFFAYYSKEFTEHVAANGEREHCVWRCMKMANIAGPGAVAHCRANCMGK